MRARLTALAAVLLALSVGILVGGVVLDPAASTIAPATNPAAGQALRRTQEAADAFARQVGPRLVKDSLTRQKVLVVLTPDASATLRDSALTELRSAGATIAGQVRLRPDLLDPAGTRTIEDVVAAVVPAGLTLPETNAIDRAGAELASVLLVAAKPNDFVLAGFSGADLLTVEGATPVPATMVLVLTGPARGPQSAAVASLAAAFQNRGGVVVAGPVAAALPQGVVSAVRELHGKPSTVDGADQPPGLIAIALALAEQGGGGTGDYGTGRGARALVP